MTYAVRLTRTVARTVANLHPEIKIQFRPAANGLAEHPYSGKELQEELSGYFSYRFRQTGQTGDVVAFLVSLGG